MPSARSCGFFGVLLLTCFAGCRSGQPTGGGEPRRQPLLEIVHAEPGGEPIDAAVAFPLEPAREAFTVLDEQGQPAGELRMTRQATTEHGATVSISEDDGARVQFLSRDEQGRIVLHAVIERDDNALTLFNPPLVVAPPTLAPGQVFSSEAAMRVVALDNPRKQRERGTARRTIAYLGDAVVRTPLGERRVAKIEAHFTADLRLADADDLTTMYIALDQAGPTGLLAEEQREKIVILGAFPRTSRRTIVRSAEH